MNKLLINDKVLKASIFAAGLVPMSAHAITAETCSDPNSAANPISSGAQCSQAKGTSGDLFGATGIFHTIANILIFIVGAIAVIMLIIGGLRYVISQGNKEHVSSAKDTILYSVIGIIVAILAFAIVNFVTGSLTPTAP
ncbi:MAG TPA: pilin [Candidatus Saccharimonadia bacterium]